MFPFNSPNACAVSLDSWLSRLKCWLQPGHSCESQDDRSHIEETSYGTTFTPVLLSTHSPLSLDLPSPTINLSFAFDSDSELAIDLESELSSTESSRCHTPLGDYPYPDASPKLLHHTELSLSTTNSAVISPKATTTPNPSRDALLAGYSHQELVLLEFVTHTSDVKTGDIDEVLLRFPPGFSHACRCTSMDEEDSDFCEVCQLLDAYMDFSLERFRGMDVAA